MLLYDRSKLSLQEKVFHRKSYYDKIEAVLSQGKIAIIQGQRYIGKSSIVAGYLQDNNIDLNSVFYIDTGTDKEGNCSTHKDLEVLFQYFCNTYQQPKYIIVDEIQVIESRRTYIQTLYYQKQFHIILTRSNQDKDIQTHLKDDNYETIEVFALGYNGYLDVTNKPSMFDNYLAYQDIGGLPGVYGLESKHHTHYLESVIDNIMINDILKHHPVKEIGYIYLLLNYMASRIATPLNIRAIHVHTTSLGRGGRASLMTVIKYLKMLQDAYIIHKITRYNITIKKHIEIDEKYYFNDIALKNVLKSPEIDDREQTLESIVFLHLKRCGYDVYAGFIRNKEIDFVARKGDKQVFVQVTWTVNNKADSDKAFGGLYAINNSDAPKYLVTTDFLTKSSANITHYNIVHFLEEFQ